jgi:long-chain acyl-CoA synthetase
MDTLSRQEQQQNTMYNIPLDQLVRRVAQQDASRVALIGRGQRITYLQLDSMIDYVAYGLAKRGVKQGSRIALYMHNIPEFVMSYFAILRLGAVVVPINPFYQGQDLAYFLENSGAMAAITIAPYSPRIEELRRTLPRLSFIVSISGRTRNQFDTTITWDELTTNDLVDKLQSTADADDLAVLAYTSGTSGVPKGVALTHRALLSNCGMFENMQLTRFNFDYEEQRESSERVLCPLGLTNIFALNIGINFCLKIGGTLIIMEKFDPIATLAQLREHKATILLGTPALYDNILNAAPSVAENYNRDVFRSLRYAFSYGSRLTRLIFERFAERVHGMPIFDCYGLTEGGAVLATTAAANHPRVNSIGWALPGALPALPGVELRLVDLNTRQDVEPGNIGEFIVRGDNMMSGYFDLHKFESEMADKEAGIPVAPPRRLWLYTGDIGTVDSDGFFYVLDRKEDILILPNGDVMLPSTVEEILVQHESIKEVAVVRVSDKDGPHFEACVVLKDGVRGITEQDLLKHIRNTKTLPEYQLPTKVYVLEFLPRLRSNWRVMRRALPNYVAYM